MLADALSLVFLMTKSQTVGDAGELEVIKKVKCPNCKKTLMLLPHGYPLVDVQCTACFFRAQIKTQPSRPSNSINGAGWDIMEKNLKSGHQIPPLIVNFKWKTGQEIRFYPFIPKQNLKKRILSHTARRADYRMFNYTEMKNLPHFVLYRIDR